MAVPLPIPAEFDQASVTERLEYVQALWDKIAATPEQVAVPDWHRQVIERRMDSLRALAADGISWKEARARLLSELDQRFPKP